MIELKNIKKSFAIGGVQSEVLKGINLTIDKGEFVAIIGQSGSGKSTLMNILGCLDTPTSGTYLLENQDISKFDRDGLSALRLKKFGFIFQRYNLLSSNDSKSNVALPGVYAGVSKAKRLEIAKELLDKLGLKEKCDAYPNHLSGGQQQRVSIARALMNGGEILLCDEPTGALDSASGVMVMEILRDLHKDGHTIIVVTHDKEIAAWANRVIEIKDGNIINDTKKSAQIYEYKEPKNTKKSKFNSIKDRFFESFAMSVGAIKAHKLRSFLTMLGIIIGIASVICVVALAKGSQEKILADINNMGTNTISLYPGKGFGDRNSNKVKSLTIDDSNFLEQLDFVDYSTPRMNTSGLLTYANKSLDASLRGGSQNSLSISNVKISSGRDFVAEDIYLSKSNIIIDQFVKKEFFKDVDPIGKVILFNRQPFTIIGVANREDTSFSGDSLTVFAPYTTTMNKLTGDRNIRSIAVKLKDGVNAQVAEQSIIEVMQVRRGAKDFFTRNTDTIMQTVQSTMNTMSLLISGIALISLMVGGIGVMNIMLVSVFERTKEIGIRMAIGAKSNDIMLQFLIEAILLCAIGGVVGVGLAYAIGYLVNLAGAGFTMIFSTASIVIAIGVSSLIGIIFGYIPARNASRLNPIDALLRE
ncbi:macrolide-specific efflux protein, ATP-binding/permease protein MacB [Campylobacter iguaniorum]|uniref:Pyoverdine export ATP-binding/permease protein PvdT n=1 Tax=Campylobacter iguaniorum TaxID=1244531 RepID=A0A076FC00_9BACT|nr:MacB family efflux pump subunit [Campylobacter iguaniorum]AII14947.1 macrolide-specific efflux protein, ATP-binding/permease protein MacB [Campylobacter iguaniorum]ALV24775.1 macrolide-specific efflux protein, ATP-binding/permease protein MacB [Campylobacter iguaniorum]